VKDKDVDEAHGKSEGVHSKGGVPHVEKNGLQQQTGTGHSAVSHMVQKLYETDTILLVD